MNSRWWLIRISSDRSFAKVQKCGNVSVPYMLSLWSIRDTKDTTACFSAFKRDYKPICVQCTCFRFQSPCIDTIFHLVTDFCLRREKMFINLQLNSPMKWLNALQCSQSMVGKGTTFNQPVFSFSNWALCHSFVLLFNNLFHTLGSQCCVMLTLTWAI